MNQENYTFLTLALLRKLKFLRNNICNIHSDMYQTLQDKKLYFYCQQEFKQLENFFDDVLNSLAGTEEYIKTVTKMSEQEYDNFVKYLQTMYRAKLYGGEKYGHCDGLD